MKLEIKDLHASVDGQKILGGVNLTVNEGEIVALMGPNGSGKSTLANVLMGNPRYTVDSGEILLDGKNVIEMSPDERAKKGLFLSFQYPSEISGVSVTNFLRTAYRAVKDSKISVIDFHKRLKEKMQLLAVDDKFATRYLNEGFSGGEKKKNEILQMAVMEPRIAICDETDSGLDADSLRIVGEGLNKLGGKTKMGILLITHYNRILRYIKPNRVAIMIQGRIVEEGGAELADEIEAKGYKKYIQKLNV